MKQFFFSLLCITASMLAASCVDDLETRIDGIEDRVERLEEIVDQLNSGLSALQGLMN